MDGHPQGAFVSVRRSEPGAVRPQLLVPRRLKNIPLVSSAPSPAPKQHVITEFIVGPLLPADAAAVAASPPHRVYLPPSATGGPPVPPQERPPASARLPQAAIDSVGARLTRGAAGVAGEQGGAVLRAVFGAALPWKEVYD